MLAGFLNSFTIGFTKKFAIKHLSCFSPHINCVSTLPCKNLKLSFYVWQKYLWSFLTHFVWMLVIFVYRESLGNAYRSLSRLIRTTRLRAWWPSELNDNECRLFTRWHVSDRLQITTDRSNVDGHRLDWWKSVRPLQYLVCIALMMTFPSCVILLWSTVVEFSAPVRAFWLQGRFRFGEITFHRWRDPFQFRRQTHHANSWDIYAFQ